MVQFSLYVNKNADSLRDSFLNAPGRTGKEELIVRVPGSGTGQLRDVNYRTIVHKLSNLILSKLKPDSNWILPNFTTTTPDDFVTNGVVLMSTMQPYFDYKSVIGCGIPNITLLGTTEDWMKLKNK